MQVRSKRSWDHALRLTLRRKRVGLLRSRNNFGIGLALDKTRNGERAAEVPFTATSPPVPQVDSGSAARSTEAANREA